MKILLLSTLSIFLIILIPAFAVPSMFGSDCTIQSSRPLTETCEDLNNLNNRLIEQEIFIETTNSTILNLNELVTNQDFSIEILNNIISNLDDQLVIQETQLAVMNTTLNDVTSIINELTVLHYPEDEVVPITPPVPEIVPLPEYPVTGENPEFAPDTPKMYGVYSYIGGAFIGTWGLDEEDHRFETSYPMFVVEYSDNGVNWETVEKQSSESNMDMFVNGDFYIEYLVKMYAYNDFGVSNSTLVHSFIPTEFGDNTSPWVDDVEWDYAYINWNNVDTFTHTPLHQIIERSTNYGVFEVIEATYDANTYDYTDTDVISGEIYSYRVTMVTDFETQTRSGFASVLIP